MRNASLRKPIELFHIWPKAQRSLIQVFAFITITATTLTSCRSLMLPPEPIYQGQSPFRERSVTKRMPLRPSYPNRTSSNWADSTERVYTGPYPSRAASSGGPLPELMQSNQTTYFKQVAPSAWRCKVPADQLLPLIARHLSGSYILAQTDLSARTIVTEWDKFFIGGRLFRNKISISLFSVSPFETEMLVMNKLEYFQQNSERQTYGESDWIPTQDITNERAQLIDSLSHLLHSLNLASAAGSLTR